jgi:hypothetical protein
MIRRFPLVCCLLSVALLCGWAGAGVLPGPGIAAAATVPGVWHSPELVPGLPTLNTGQQAELSFVSCSAPGECAGGGFYVDGAGHFQAFVVDERSGVWGVAREVPGSAALNAGGNLVLNAISCASPGNCAAGGSYSAAGTSGPVADVFVASEAQGTWAAALEVAGTDDTNATLNSVSCGSAGDCVAGGSTGTSAYTVTETSGTRGSAQPVAGTAALPGASPRSPRFHASRLAATRSA